MRFLRALVVFSSLVAPVAVGCGGTSDNGSGAPGGADAGPDTMMITPMVDSGGGTPDAADANVAPYPAELPTDFPQVVSGGGPVMATPKIVPVLFAVDDATTKTSIADFVKKVGATEYWKAATTEYGVGAGTGLDPVLLTAADDPAMTVDDSEIQTWLAGKLNADDPAFPKPDANTLYAIFYPANVTITIGGGAPPPSDAGADAGGGGGFGGVQSSCTAFGGYHQNIQLDAAHQTMNVAYAVVPRCANFGNLTGIDMVTGAGSHEMLEAVTDPFPLAMNPGYAQVDDAHIFWQGFLGGGEVGDMCAQYASSFTKFAELPYTVQRSWSNKAESGGHDPCVPAMPGEVYFNSVPVLPDMIAFSAFGQTVNVRGVKIPAGQSKTIPLQLWSEAATTGPWTVKAVDFATARGQTAQLAFSFDKTSGANGDTIQMTIKVVTASKRNHESFIVISKLGGVEATWIGVVGN